MAALPSIPTGAEINPPRGVSHTLPLHQDEYDNASYYGGDSSRKIRLSRGLEAIISSEEVRGAILRTTKSGSFKGALYGGTLGFMAFGMYPPAAIVKVAGKLGGAILSAIGGGAVCGGAGALVGGALGGTYSIVTLKDSKEYQKWKGDKLKELALPAFWENFTGLSELVDFRCPITHDFIVDPVKAEDGKIYERAFVEQHIRNVNAQLARMPAHRRARERINTSPLRIDHITIEGLEYVSDYHTNLFKAIRTVYNQAVTADLATGVDAYRRLVQPQRDHIAQQLTQELQRQRTAGALSLEQYMGAIREVERYRELPKLLP